MTCIDSRARSIVLVALALLAWANAGCSFLFVDKPPDNHRELASFDCSSGRGWPATDLVMGGIYALTSVVGATVDEQQMDDGTTKTVPSSQRVGMALAFGGLAALHGVSAVYGFSGVSSCRDANHDLIARRGMPASTLRGSSAALTRVTLRSGEVVEGRILGELLVAPKVTQNGNVNSMSFSIVEGSDVSTVDSRGAALWRYPSPDVRLWIVSNELGLPLGVPHALLILVTGSAGDAGQVILTATASELGPGRSLAGELTFSMEGRRVQLAPTIRVETARGVVSIPVSDLAAGANGAVDGSSAPPSATTSPAPILEAGPPGASDWTTEYRGRGGLTVTVRNGSTIPVFVKIRDNTDGSTAAQVPVSAGQDSTVHLGTGNFDVLMRAETNGRVRYFKGNPISVPSNAIGTAVLTVGLSGNGEALEEVDAAEFNR